MQRMYVDQRISETDCCSKHFKHEATCIISTEPQQTAICKCSEWKKEKKLEKVLEIVNKIIGKDRFVVKLQASNLQMY